MRWRLHGMQRRRMSLGCISHVPEAATLWIQGAASLTFRLVDGAGGAGGAGGAAGGFVGFAELELCAVLRRFQAPAAEGGSLGAWGCSLGRRGLQPGCMGLQLGLHRAAAWMRRARGITRQGRRCCIGTVRKCE